MWKLQVKTQKYNARYKPETLDNILKALPWYIHLIVDISDDCWFIKSWSKAMSFTPKNNFCPLQIKAIESSELLSFVIWPDFPPFYTF